MQNEHDWNTLQYEYMYHSIQVIFSQINTLKYAM